ncbi:TPA: hypothetical protein I8Y21_006334 [Klebsiella oxytoca]|uniref:Uncharacterized protein n=1 Tax=Klebsiella oxytoca TaxID=571 RepID=A0AAN5LFA2_KLEOX|nr:hypothetical protein [Klebsiella oxytoca]
METVSQVPEGYRPLPVTEFVVDAEKNDTYDIAVGVEYPGKPSDAQEWIEKNITGQIELYRIKDNELISTHFVFNKKNDHSKAGVNRVYLNRVYQGETYSISLNKGKYMILSRLFFKSDTSRYDPQVFISFNRFKTAWW